MSWLADQGYSRQLVHGYVKNGWLVSIGHGVYCKAGQGLDWKGAVLGVQQYLKLPLHVGGITAMNMQGLAQYLPLASKEKVHLWGVKAPSWLNRLKLDGSFIVHKQNLFEGDDTLALEKIPVAVRNWRLYVSSPERAVMEMLSTVESEDDFMQAAELFEGMTQLRPELLNTLLVHCKSIKVKRLFLFLAHHYKFSWVNRLDVKNVDLGKGKRQVIKEGRYDSQYRITIPKKFGSAFNSAFSQEFN